MSFKTLPLSELNRLSEKKSFSLEGAKLSAPDRSRIWAPAELPPLTHLAEYGRMSPPERLRYNQLYALGVLEQFIWLESRILCRVIERIRKCRDISSELRTGLDYFYDEEVKHSELFWRLLEAAEPEFYPSRRFYFLDTGSIAIRTVEAMIDSPNIFIAWVWMAIFFEERTLDFSKRYVAAEARAPGSIDPNFYLVHKLHMQDELRHFMMDIHLLGRFYDGQNRLKRALAARMFRVILARLSSPRAMSKAYIERLGSEFKGFHERAGEALMRARPHLKINEDFKKISMSAESTPRTYALLHRYDETRPLQALFAKA